MQARLFHKAMRRAASLPADLALRGINLPPVLGHLERRHARTVGAHLRRHPGGDAPASALPAREAAIVEALERDGVCVTSLDALDLGGSGVLEDGQRLAATLAARVAAMGGKRPTMIAATPDDMVGHPLLYRWGLDATLLRIIEAYLRLPVAFDGPLLFHTSADGREAGTRKWHLDREDRRVIKLALYLHDVDENSGPFQILRHESRQGGQPFRYTAHDTDALARHLGRGIGPGDATTCVGPAGTLVFADTARFYHRGKPATGRARSAIFYGYFARRPRHPFYCARSGIGRPQVARLVEGLSPAQQACALWRDELPLLARLVPPSLI